MLRVRLLIGWSIFNLIGQERHPVNKAQSRYCSDLRKCDEMNRTDKNADLVLRVSKLYNFIAWGLKIKLRICISMGWNASWVNFDFESEPQKRKMVLTVYYRRVHTEENMRPSGVIWGHFRSTQKLNLVYAVFGNSIIESFWSYDYGICYLGNVEENYVSEWHLDVILKRKTVWLNSAQLFCDVTVTFYVTFVHLVCILYHRIRILFRHKNVK